MHLLPASATITREALATRFSFGRTVPGTMSYRLFAPQKVGVISYKRCADDTEFAGRFDFLNFSAVQQITPKDQDLVAALYNDYWWVGVVQMLDGDSDDVFVKFMAPHGPSVSFYWPSREDICWVLKCDILAILSTPSTSSSGRNYKLYDDDHAKLANIMS